MFCEKCGAKIDEGAVFCSECGADLTNDMQEAAPVSEPVLETAPQIPEISIEEVLAQPPVPPQSPAMPYAQSVPVYVPVQPVQPPVQPAQNAKKPYQRWKPHIALRIPMQLLSFVLCLVLMVSLVAAVVLADLNQMTSAGGIKQIIQAVLSPAQAPTVVRPVGAVGVGDLDLGQLPEDALSGVAGEDTGALIDWIYGELEKNAQEELPFDKEQLQNFVEKSTVTDFLAEKVADYADDYLNGTENATITTDEILDLLEENEALIEQEFKIEITEEQKEKMAEAVDKVVVETDLNNKIRTEVFASVDKAIEESTASLGGLSKDQILDTLQLLSADQTMWTAIGICGVIMLLLCLLNFYNLPAGLTWIAAACMIIGLILAAPVAILQAAPELIGSMVPQAGFVLQIVSSFLQVLAPIHYGLPALGLGLLILSIVWRAIRSEVERKRRLAAV